MQKHRSIATVLSRHNFRDMAAVEKRQYKKMSIADVLNVLHGFDAQRTDQTSRVATKRTQKMQQNGECR